MSRNTFTDTFCVFHIKKDILTNFSKNPIYFPFYSILFKTGFFLAEEQMPVLYFTGSCFR